jgi:glycosyltransferase involved in cell wall biosynthesis
MAEPGPKKHIVLLEPYYGGSHKAFLDGLCKHVDLRFTLITLPARKWKMRMQLAAPWMAEQILALYKKGVIFDAILCSTFLDVAVLRSLLAQQGLQLPLAVYFHENQFAYPSRIRDPAFFQFTNINWTTALSADHIFFNSKFNFESFLSGIKHFLSKHTDINLLHTIKEIQGKSTVLYPGIDYSIIDQVEPDHVQCPLPVIIWNHRWEHDKDPQTFFSALFTLKKQGANFRLIVLGQHFQHQPEIFSKAREKLKEQIIHFGYVKDRKKYAALLSRGDVVVSTARHEFFGISVLEAVRAGCCPLVPDRLSYPELYPPEFRYDCEPLHRALVRVLRKQGNPCRREYHRLAAKFSWQKVARTYEEYLFRLCSAMKIS